ncbi:MAG: 2-amino-4-hydroxy-6-hydroxymethyldihydropteridine diphosphokinase [Alphaproteobacteria bacterium]
MILIGIGANLPSARCGPPERTCEAALETLAAEGVCVLRRSRWYRSAPVPPSEQPWYVNGVVQASTRLGPKPLLELLHRIERAFGRVRAEPNAARVIDLDLLAYDDLITDGPDEPLLPHPRMHQRAFVLLPLAEIAPEWRHPVTGEPIDRLIAALPPDQTATPVE